MVGAHDGLEEMYARTWRFSVGALPERDAIDMMVDVLLPEVASLPGFCGATLLVDRSTSELNATVYWATLADLHASRSRETNAATGALVLVSGDEMVAAVHDVVFHVPAPAVTNRDVGQDR